MPDKIDKLVKYANATNIDLIADLYIFDLISFDELKQVSDRMNSDLNFEEVQRCYDELHKEE